MSPAKRRLRAIVRRVACVRCRRATSKLVNPCAECRLRDACRGNTRVLAQAEVAFDVCHALSTGVPLIAPESSRLPEWLLFPNRVLGRDAGGAT